jgi:TetR/AcrR family transcriptional regulator, mexJK operon transcriptional repressor
MQARPRITRSTQGVITSSLRLTTGLRSRMLPRRCGSTPRRLVTMRRARRTLAPMVPPSSAERAASPIAAGKNHRRSPTRKARHGGRPSRAAALQLRDRILGVATELFLTEGYGSTSIEAVSGRAGISKRTFYHRFNDKAALFAAAVHRIIEQIRPPPEVPLLEGATLQEILRRLAGLILHAALSPQAIALHRLVTAESARFPNLVRAVYDEGWAEEASTLIGNLLARELRDPRLTLELQGFAAAQFLHMVVALPQRRMMGLGTPMTPRELEAWADDVVNLFLNGCRGLSGGSARQRR